MARRERDDVIAALQEERIDADDKCTAALLGHRRERGVDLAVSTSPQDNELQPKHTCSRLHISQLALGTRKIRIHECRDRGGRGTSSRSSPSCFDPSSTSKL